MLYGLLLLVVLVLDVLVLMKVWTGAGSDSHKLLWTLIIIILPLLGLLLYALLGERTQSVNVTT